VQIVASKSVMNLDETLLFNVPELKIVLLTPESTARQMAPAVATRPWIRVVTMQSADDLRRAFAQLRREQIARVSCIGGRTLARMLLDTALVDDLYLTTGAQPGGQPDTPLHAGPWRRPVIVRKHGTGVERG